MINKIWGGMILLSFFCAAVCGRMEALSQAILAGAQQAVTLSISMLGMMGAWMGILQVADACGITKKIAAAAAPVMHALFPGIRGDASLQSKISMNLAANLLGLGNAATPLGIAAVQELAQKGGVQADGSPGRELTMFVVLNTASVQLIPTYMAALRSACGSTQPYSVLPYIWAASLAAACTAVIAVKVMEGGTRPCRLRRSLQTGQSRSFLH